MKNRANTSAQSRSKFFSIKRSSEFDEIYQSGRKVRPANWLMVVVSSAQTSHQANQSNEQNQSNDLTFFGVTASRKVGSAVIRNKLKRWIRALAKADSWPKSLLFRKVIFVFRPQPEGFYKNLEFQEFKSVLERIKL